MGGWESQHFCCVSKCHEAYPRFYHLFNDWGSGQRGMRPIPLRLKTPVELLHLVSTKYPDLIPAGKGIACPGPQSPV